MEKKVKQLLIILCVLLMAVITASAQEQEDEGGTDDPVIRAEVIGGDEEQLREFVSRFAAPFYYFGPDATSPAVYIGSLPDDLPFEVPLPEGVEVVGSVAGTFTRGYTQILLDAAGTVDDVREFYTQAMAELGWEPAPDMHSGGGFRNPQPASLAFCSEDQQYVFNVLALEAEDRTSVNISIQEANPGPCADTTTTRYGMYDLLPVIEVPAGARITGSSTGGGGTDGSSQTSATIISSLSVREIAAHLRDQLAQAGWELQSGEDSDFSSVSTWTTTDEDGEIWNGVLIVVRASEEDRTAFFQMTRQR